MSDGQLDMRGIDPLLATRFFVRKRDGRREEFNEARIFLAIESAFRATLGIEPQEPLRDMLQIEIRAVAEPVVQRVLARAIKGEELEVEGIQDAVEEQLMRAGHLAIARRYILYRDERRRARFLRETLSQTAESPPAAAPAGSARSSGQSLSAATGKQWTVRACRVPEQTSVLDSLVAECAQRAEPGIAIERWLELVEDAAKSKIRLDPQYEQIAARLLLRRVSMQAVPGWDESAAAADLYRAQFAKFAQKGVELRLLAHELLEFNLESLASALKPERDDKFNLAGLELLSNAHLLREKGKILEAPQYFWMRLAMGLALNEAKERTTRAMEFYETLSTFRFIPSDSILRGAGLQAQYLTDCFAVSGWSDLEHVTARTAVPASGGNEPPPACSWLEVWHIQFLEFLSHPHGDEDRWAQDLRKGAWIPDLFMKRVRENKDWTLFDPSDAPDLHHLSGAEFENRYLQYEDMARRGEISSFEHLPAAALWDAILGSILDVGQPMLGFKDAASIRATQDKNGVVQNAGLSGGILLPGAPNRVAVCAGGAVNLPAHLAAGKLDLDLLRSTVEAAVRMLDNALDNSAYPDSASAAFGMAQRPIGLGVAGFQEMLQMLKIGYAGAKAPEWADRSMESISWFALTASSNLAAERGAYPAFEMSGWKLGMLPPDTFALLQKARGSAPAETKPRHDWNELRKRIAKNGIRNCAVTAVLDTNDGSLLASVTSGAEPSLDPLAGSSAYSTPWNALLVAALKEQNLWNDSMRSALQNAHGSIQSLNAIPASIREAFRNAAEIDPRALIDCAARRQKWIDMGQPMTIYTSHLAAMAQLREIFMAVWESGLKAARAATAPFPSARPEISAPPQRELSGLEQPLPPPHSLQIAPATFR
jgi:ribonucleoside-diphosphate reductase alpha chain